MKYPKIRELKEAVIALVKGPYTTKFPYEEHIPSLKFRGKPIPDEKECIGCGACAFVCPANAIELVDDKVNKVRSLTWHYDLCIFCGQCEMECTTEKGVKLSNKEFDLATSDRKTLFSTIKKEILVCPLCDEVIAPKDQILWIGKKLGDMAFGNYTVFSVLLKELGFGDLNLQKGESISKRQDFFKITCPKCRRINLLIDEYGKIDFEK
jgi:formate hydrogenlyase subunit 6/NADH:ubiquinone oxidoreductase subunit I